MLVTQLSPHGHDLGEPFDRVVRCTTRVGMMATYRVIAHQRRVSSIKLLLLCTLLLTLAACQQPARFQAVAAAGEGPAPSQVVPGG